MKVQRVATVSLIVLVDLIMVWLYVNPGKNFWDGVTLAQELRSEVRQYIIIWDIFYAEFVVLLAITIWSFLRLEWSRAPVRAFTKLIVELFIASAGIWLLLPGVDTSRNLRQFSVAMTTVAVMAMFGRRIMRLFKNLLDRFRKVPVVRFLIFVSLVIVVLSAAQAFLFSASAFNAFSDEKQLSQAIRATARVIVLPVLIVSAIRIADVIRNRVTPI